MISEGHQRKKLFWILTFLLSTGFLVTSLGSFYVSRKSVRNQILSDELPLTSDTIYSEIQRDLLSPIFISSLMANDTFLRNWMIEGEKNIGDITQYLNEIKTKYHTFTSFLVSDKTRNYYHVSGILKQVDPAEERDIWYYRVRSMDADYEINVDPDLGNKDTMTIFINHKVFDFEGNYIGATGVGLTIDSVKTVVSRYREMFNRDIFFTDKDGRILIGNSRSHGDIDHVRDLSGLAGQVPAILSRKSDSLTYTANGEVIHLNTRYIPELQWYLWVEQAEKGKIRKIYMNLLMNLFICFIITAMVITLVRMLINDYRKKIDIMDRTDRELRNINLIQHHEIIRKNTELTCKNEQLQSALDEVDTLSGFIPICACCKKIRDDQGYWEQIESYIAARSQAQFSHSICPDCIKKVYPDLDSSGGG